ncbi:MerR family transcriptional regulator [Micromonospora narathiwatensis]|uniref:DNA-binding transcriptional regulator, MerR family n=1 Tax=Micromonospora narathiwatensis TaxID=299146 RepID=A0A1A8ZEZ5_9ACTN|nr:MerR family transcriptional regulator [Micromonospora narathiwatensis]SBT42406.1 DNA-binding transcriptional regulator, MerR family [Micromonospora narathiwatensis]
MFTIGEFAVLGRVSVRMLRHYDGIGLLHPAVVDPHTGYRYYRAAQLGRLNRVVALKDLGLTLEQVRAVLDDEVDANELRGMLRLRRAQLAAQVAADTARLARIAARLRMLETEGRMTTEDVVLKEIPAVRIAEVTAVAASYETPDIGPVIQPLYPELFRRLDEAHVGLTGPAIAWYEPEGGGEAVVVHAGATVGVDPGPDQGFAVVDLPAVPTAATIVHHGAMDEVEASMQVLARWIEENGWRAEGYAREVYLEYCQDEPEKGVTELQIPVSRR